VHPRSPEWMFVLVMNFENFVFHLDKKKLPNFAVQLAAISNDIDIF